MATTSTFEPKSAAERPAFSIERLALDAETATEIIHETLAGVTAADADGGVRTTGGTLLAVLAGTGAGTVELDYRTAPASATATLKARRLRRALEPDAR